MEVHYSQSLRVTPAGTVVVFSQSLGATPAGATRPSTGGAAVESQPSPATGVIHGNKEPKNKMCCHSTWERSLMANNTWILVLKRTKYSENKYLFSLSSSSINKIDGRFRASSPLISINWSRNCKFVFPFTF